MCYLLLVTELINAFQMWVKAFRLDRLLIDMNTTNGVESLNSSFKRIHLKVRGNLEDLAKTIVLDFLPSFERK